MDKSKFYLDLSKCTEEEQEHIFSLLPEPINEEDYMIFDSFYNLHSHNERWYCGSSWVSIDKTELTYPEFIKLFEGGESKEVLQVENNGWIKFENEKPNFNDYCYCWLLTKDGEILLREWNPHSKGFYGWREVYFTHYQPIQKPEPPKF